MQIKSIFWSRSIYVLATISLANHYHNISGKAFVQTEYYKRFSGNALPEFLLKRLCVLSQKRTDVIITVLFWDNIHNLYKRNSGKHLLTRISLLRVCYDECLAVDIVVMVCK